LVSKVLDPPKSPLKRGTLIPVPPFLRGVRGDLNVSKITAKYFSNNLLNEVLDNCKLLYMEKD